MTPKKVHIPQLTVSAPPSPTSAPSSPASLASSSSDCKEKLHASPTSAPVTPTRSSFPAADVTPSGASTPPTRTTRHEKAASRGLRLSRLPAVPKHMIASGQEGYRTPTIEDYEDDLRLSQAANGKTGGLSSPAARANVGDFSWRKPSTPLSPRSEKVESSAHDYFRDRTHGKDSLPLQHHQHHRYTTSNASGVSFSRNNSKINVHWSNAGLESNGKSSAASSGGVASLGERLLDKLNWRERIRHYTWTFFTITMATGGVANVLYTVPFRFPGLYAIGVIFFLLNIVLFIINVTLISLRFYMYPETFRASILHPTERLFVPAAVVSFGTILLNISQYGPNHGAGQWLNDAVAVLYWIDVALACIFSTGIYLVMWSTASFTISQMTPLWIFPAYPLLIIGPHAGVLSITLSQEQAFDIIIGGFTLQGIGFLASMMIYSAFIYRLMTQKLPREAMRPAMFVSVGPSAFTAAGVLGMAEGVQNAMPADFFSDIPLAASIIKVIATFLALWLWGLAVWFFFIALGSHYSCLHKGHHLTFTMSWFSYVFPNTALITATFAVGKSFRSTTIQILGCVMTPILILTWILVCAMMIRAIWLKQILWPQKGEDRDEGGFKGPRARPRSHSVA